MNLFSSKKPRRFQSILEKGQENQGGKLDWYRRKYESYKAIDAQVADYIVFTELIRIMKRL